MLTTQPSRADVLAVMRQPQTWLLGVPYLVVVTFLVIGIVHRFNILTTTTQGLVGVILVAVAAGFSLLARVVIIASVQMGQSYPVLVIVTVLSWLVGLLLIIRRDLQTREVDEVAWQYDVTTFSYAAVATMALMYMFIPELTQGA